MRACFKNIGQCYVSFKLIERVTLSTDFSARGKNTDFKSFRGGKENGSEFLFFYSFILFCLWFVKGKAPTAFSGQKRKKETGEWTIDVCRRFSYSCCILSTKSRERKISFFHAIHFLPELISL